MREHLLQFFHAIVCERGDGFIVPGVDGNDVTVAQIIVVGDDCLKKLRIFFENLRDKFDCTDVGNCCHQAASAEIVTSRDQFHGNSSSSQLIL